MGSGKTYWGKIWAEKYKMPFVDLDHEIEKAMGMSIEDIFEKYGEAKFRDLEREYLRKSWSDEGVLISCGGGTPCFYDNIGWMIGHGKVIFLNASPRYLLNRVLDEKNKRPLMKDQSESELIFFIEKKLKERMPVYLRANVILDAESVNENSFDTIMKDFELPHEEKSSLSSGKTS